MNRLLVAGSTDAPGRKPPTDPPPGLIAVPAPKIVLLLTEAEYIRGIKRGKWWRRCQTMFQCEAKAATPPTHHSAGSSPKE